MNVVISPTNLKTEAETADLGRSQTISVSAESRLMDAYWQAANYLSVGQIHLHDNPMLREPLKLSHVKSWWWGIWARRLD